MMYDSPERAREFGLPADHTLGPVAPGERLVALDVLRGWTMFGVLWSNLVDWYGTTGPSTSVDRALAFAQDWLVEGHFYTLLSILFGIGFAIQLQRAGEKDASGVATYYRRLAVLFGLGLVHAFMLWPGDILKMYAIAGCALLLFRAMPARRLPWAALGVWILIPFMFSRARMLAGYTELIPWTQVPAQDWMLAHGSWLQIQHIRADFVMEHTGRFALAMFFPDMLMLMLLGLWAFRSGFMKRATEETSGPARLLVFSIVAVAAGFAGAYALSELRPSGGAQGAAWTELRFWIPRQRLMQLPEEVALLGATLAYAAIILLVWRTSWGARRLAALAATGRMALTTYLTQSVVCTLLFYGYGLGWYGRVGYRGMLGIALVVFAAQMAVSVWWLRRYRYGPVEWLWRSLTYGRVLPRRV